MPFGDRTGPMGLGPMTGRGAGFCGGFNGPGNMNFGRGLGGGMGRGFGGGMGRGRHRGWRDFNPEFQGWMRGGRFAGRGNFYPSPEFDMSPDEEREILKSQARHLEKDLKDLQNRISEIEKTDDKK